MRRLLVDPILNSLKWHHKNYMAESKENWKGSTFLTYRKGSRQPNQMHMNTFDSLSLLLSADLQRYSPERAEDSLSSDTVLLTDDKGSYLTDDPPVEIKSYKRRFYILLLFSVISFSQYCAWNTYGPIATTAKMVFNWTNTEIAFLASMDPITYLCSMFFFSWLMDEKGNSSPMI